MKYHKLVENAKKPNGFWGKMMIKAMNKGHSSLTSWGLEHMNIERTATVLDIGCGGGKTVDRLCSIVANGKVYGVDYSELSVKSSEKLNSKNILCNKAKILQASVSDMPFDDNTFDNITAVETYYFWPDKENDVKEVFRVLKQGGTVMLLFEMLRTDDDPFKWEKVENMLNIKSVTPQEIRAVLESAGFENINTYTKEGTTWLCATAQKPKDDEN